MTNYKFPFYYTHIKLHEIPNLLPDGWVPFYEWIEKLATLCNVYDINMWYYRGMLMLKTTQTLNQFETQVFNNAIGHVRKESKKRCLVCGSKAQRKKQETNWPPLCTQHYVQYVNELDQSKE